MGLVWWRAHISETRWGGTRALVMGQKATTEILDFVQNDEIKMGTRLRPDYIPPKRSLDGAPPRLWQGKKKTS
jgi:hypothetical protein